VIEPGALFAWSALALIVTLTPGPDTLLVASHAARTSFRAGMAALAGIMTAVVFFYGSLIAFGALSILVAVPALFLAVKIAGAMYLAWLGAGMIWSAVRGRRGEAQAKPLDLKQPYSQGFLTNALNPKIAMFYLAALPQFASGENAPLIGVMLLGIHAVFGFAWLSVIAFAAARARTIAWNNDLVRWLEGAVGAFFLGLAGRLALVQR
jgi:threonine/homoserine/homoserine lactone efflux protein